MAERDFDAERKKRPGHKFTLGGKTFRTYPGVPITTVRKPPEQVDGQDSVDLVTGFIRQMLVKTDQAAWDKMLNDPDIYIDAEDLLDVSKWLSDLIKERLEERGDAVKAETNGTKKSKATKVVRKPVVKTLGDK